jgi:hypothetical protein
MTPFPATPPLDDDSADAIVNSVAPTLGIAIDPAWRDAVVTHLKATGDAARLVLDFTLPDELEPAPVFRA